MSKDIKRIGADPELAPAEYDENYAKHQAAILAAAGVAQEDIERTLGAAAPDSLASFIRKTVLEEPFRRFFEPSGVNDEDCLALNFNPDKFGGERKDVAFSILTAGVIAMLSHLVREADSADRVLPLVQQQYEYDEIVAAELSAVLLLHRDAEVPGDFMDLVPVFGVSRPHPDLVQIARKRSAGRSVDGFAFKGLKRGGLFTYVSVLKGMDFSIDKSVFESAEVHLFSSTPDASARQTVTFDDFL